MTSRLLSVLASVGLVLASTCAVAAPATRPSVVHDLIQLPAPAKDWRVHLGWVTEDRVDEPMGTNDRLRDDPAAMSADDDAVIAYWFYRASTTERHREPGLFRSDEDRRYIPAESPRISDVQRQRLLRAVIARPDNRLTPLVNLLPNTPEAHDQLKKLLDAHPLRDVYGPVDESSYDIDWRWPWQRKVKLWLMHRSEYFRDELQTTAGSLGKFDSWEGRLALESLVKLDLAAARRLRDALVKSPVPTVPALTHAQLFHAESAAGEADAAEAHRAALQAILVEHHSGDVANIAADALAGTPWADRAAQEAWVKVVLEEGDVHSAVAYGLRHDLKRWQPLVAAQITQSPADRRPYVVESYVILLSSAQVDAGKVRPLLPWLKDPDWANGKEDRNTVIGWVAGLDMPETAADMLALLRDGQNAALAAPAVARYKPRGAIEALRSALAQDELRDEAFTVVLDALISADGISEVDAAAAIEAYLNDPNPFGGGGGGLFGNPPRRDMQIAIGRGLARRGLPDYGERPPATIGMGDGVAQRLADLADRRRTTEPEFTGKVCELLADWTSPAACRYLVGRALAADSTAEDIAVVARNAAKMRVAAGPELRRALAAGGRGAVIAAAVLGDSGVCRQFVEAGDREIAALTLAVARLVRTPIDIGVVAGRLAKIPPGAKDAADDQLARAAEMYLIAADTAESRNIVWTRHPGEMIIVGPEEGNWSNARESTLGEQAMRESTARFDDLRKELRGQQPAVVEVFALEDCSGYGMEARHVIRVLPDGSATLTITQRYSRSRHRPLSAAELTTFRNMLKELAVDELPSLPAMAIDGNWYRFLRLTPAGGRRVYMNNPDNGPATPHKKLVEHFQALEDAGGFQITYAALSAAVPGLRVIHTRPNYGSLTSVWRAGDDLRVLNFGEGKWFAGDDENSTRTVAAPAGRHNPKFWDDIPKPLRVAERADLPVTAADGSILCRARGDAWREQIWKYKPGGKPVQLTDDGKSYSSFAASADGKWVLADYGDGLTRVDLTTGRNFDLKLPGRGSHDVLGYNPAHGKFVASRSGDGKADHFLVDPVTGKVEPVIGDFDGLAEAFAAGAQPSNRPNLVWVARLLPEEPDGTREPRGTEIGLYDLKTFRFETVFRLPMVSLDMHRFWVDHARGEILIAMIYDVIAIPLPKEKLNAS